MLIFALSNKNIKVMKRLIIIFALLITTIINAAAQKVNIECNIYNVNKKEGQWRKLWRLDDPDGGYVFLYASKHPEEIKGTPGVLLIKDCHTDNYWAYDIECPECKNRGLKKRIIMGTNLVAECNHCGSEWQNIHMGSSGQTNRSGKFSLKTYKAECDNGVTVHISNWF